MNRVRMRLLNIMYNDLATPLWPYMVQVELYQCCVKYPKFKLEWKWRYVKLWLWEKWNSEKILVNVSDIKHTQLSQVIFCSHMYISIKSHIILTVYVCVCTSTLYYWSKDYQPGWFKIGYLVFFWSSKSVFI